MTEVAFDSSAVVQWITQKPGWKAVAAIFDKATILYLPGPALAEVIWVARKLGNTASARQISTTLAAQGLQFEMNTDEDLIRAAGLHELSQQHPGPTRKPSDPPATLSLGDSLILAACERLACPVVTRDAYWQSFAQDGHTSANVQTF